MARNLNDQKLARAYLLRRLGKEEQSFEEQLLVDDDLSEELEIAEDELIDDYLAKRLSPEDSIQLEKNLLASTHGRRKREFAEALKKTLPKQEPIPPPSPTLLDRLREWFGRFHIARPLAVTAMILVVAGLSAVVWRAYLYQSDVDKGLMALNNAYRQERPIEARITQLDYAPFSDRRGAETTPVNSREREYAQRVLFDAVRDHPGPDSYHALGKYYLTGKDFANAIQNFEAALKFDSEDPQINADAGAAYLEKGKLERGKSETGQDPESLKGLEDLARSLEYLSKALELKPGFLEARFNRALCFEYQLLPLRAVEEWREYLKSDSGSPWADDARRHLDSLEGQKTKTSRTEDSLIKDFLSAFESADGEIAWLLIRQHRDVSGGPIENGLIDKYLESGADGQNSESLKALTALTYAGELERNRAGDLFVSDIVHFLRSMSDSQRKAFVVARGLMKAGRKSLIDSNTEAAANYYREAQETLERNGAGGAALYAEYPLGHVYLLQTKRQVSRDIFRRITERCEVRHYRWLLAQALNATANAELGLYDFSAALDASHRSLDLSREIGDTTGVVKTTNQLAQQYFMLGNYPKSLGLHQQDLELADSFEIESMQGWRNYFYVAWPLNAMGLHAAAIEYEKEALRRANAMKTPNPICRSHTALGLMYAGRHDYEQAITEVETAIELGKSIPSEIARKESIAYSSLQLGHLFRQSGDFNNSIANYDLALRLYDELKDYQAFSYLAHKGKLLSCIRLEGCPSVEEEIRTCLELFESYRLKILELSNRESFFDNEQTIYDVAIEYEFARKNFQTAFGYSERARSRSLLDSSSNNGKPIVEYGEADIKFSSAEATQSFEEIQGRVPPETQIVQYAVSGKKLLIWVLTNEHLEHAESAISLSDLSEKVLSYVKLISSPSENNNEELARKSKSLYDVLIKPIEGYLNKQKLLCIVPDKSLNFLPFGALMSAQSGKYLVDEYRISSAPSSAIFIRSFDLANQRKTEFDGNKRAPEMLLAVGNPEFDRKEYPLLADLPAAAKEVETIKTFYGPLSRVLVGSAATKQVVEAELRRSNVVHLAMHSVVDQDFPLRSKLIFAASPRRKENEGVLTAHEIYALQLPCAHLVILSACETGVGRYYRGEGMMGLSRTFIAAGVPLVIASLWQVDSDSTGDLMIAFHRFRKTENMSSAEALQKAQQAMANGPDLRYRHPYYWAGFTLIGGSASL
jgi:CHAT domain-containing protein/Tfp pilus assembly protein PilF